MFSIRKLRYPPWLALKIAFVLCIISLGPTPTVSQYFCLCVPFFAVCAVCAANNLCVTLKSRRERLAAAVAFVGLLSIYLGASAYDFRKYLITGDGIAGVSWARDKDDWRLQRVRQVSRAIDQMVSPGETVASFWPGYIFQTKATPFPGFENDYGLPVSENLTSEQRSRYHILSLADIESNFAAHTPRIVVLGNQNHLMEEAIGDRVKTSLRADGYTLVRSIGGISIYVCSSKS
jgi:xanthosine utilization system XapX-like protein